MTATPTLARRSPLGATTAAPSTLARAAGIEIRECPFLAQVLLRMASSAIGIPAVGAALGLTLPEANRLAGAPHGFPLAIWLGPDEWLIVDSTDPSDLEASVGRASAPHGGTVVDVSAHRTMLEFEGPRVREVLAAGSSIDFHPSVFDVGAAAQTQFARVDVIIGRTAADRYHLAVRASFAPYLADWLNDALANIEGEGS